MKSGYYRFPTIYKDTVVFVSEDDLWSVPLAGGVARRLTSTNGLITRPCFSPDGEHLAFSSFEEGALEVYVMPAAGGEIKRLTYLGATSEVSGWTPQGEILFTSAATNSVRIPVLMKVHPNTGECEDLGLGHGTSLSLNGQGWVVIERNAPRPDPAHWKRYRGGTAGQLWTARALNGTYARILGDLKGNYSSPHWIGERLFFLSDHEGWGNIYSCTIEGKDVQRHTHHKEFYARNLKSDGSQLVYHAGADLYHFDPTAKKSRKIEVEYHSQKPQRQRRFVSPTKTWESLHLSPKGTKLAFGSRGQIFSFNNWQGPAFKAGTQESVRYRLVRWIDEDTFALICDRQGRDHIEIYKHGETEPQRLIGGEFGTVTEMKPAPNGKFLALANHRNELILVEIEKENSQMLARNEFDFLRGDFAWAPDSRWLAFCQNLDKTNKVVQVYSLETAQTTAVTRPGIRYTAPAFDPKGEYLYFISSERLNPVYSDVMFDVFFPRTHLPCVLPLKATTQSPFLRKPEPETPVSKDEKKEKSEVRVTIDFENIAQRMLSFPVAEAIYTEIFPSDGKVFYSVWPSEGTLDQAGWDFSVSAKSSVKCFDFKTGKEEDHVAGVTEFALSQDGEWQLIRVRNQAHVSKLSEKPKLDKPAKEFNSKSGWIDFKRIKLMVDPPKEWKQMYGEIWRLQRDLFWVESMSRVDWQRVHDQYLPLIDRVSARTEFTDLGWEMQGELGTSHAYVVGGDVKTHPNYPLGFLGADFKRASEGFEITRIYDGEISGVDHATPLLQPGVNARPGDRLLAIDGVELNENMTPAQALLHKAATEVELRLRHQNGETRAVWVKTLANDKNNRYRDWVETNRRYVHEKTGGKIGYVHIPDMGPPGYSEFFRNYIREFNREGLIIDARYNGGGHVSQLILDYLSRRRIGFDKSRWTGIEPYPMYSPSGPMVALTNQYAGSDGDIFPHAFKLMKLGPLIGQRTWGGVIGISPRHFLADGGITTQPEFSFWFSDVGWGVENYGTDPDIAVDIAPHEYAKGVDPQLDRGISEVQQLLKKNPPLKPGWDSFPDLSAPKDFTSEL